LTDFNDFIELLERRERVGFLTTSLSSISEVGKYLKLEKNLDFSGNQHLALVWEALRAQRVLTFEYVPYTESGTASTTRFVAPGLLFEYQNRFYLDGWDVQKKAVRTFGLDRMQALALTDQAAPKRPPADYRNLRRHVIGVNYAKEAHPERVVLQLTTLQAHYLRSLPLHPSQRELSQTDTHVLFSLDVVINKELEIVLLGLGQAAEVLEPLSLRSKMKAEVEGMMKKYAD
jgi:predicted DNA-binding transcriptional regulator YafY